MLLEVSELFEEVIEEQLKMAEREVPPMFRRWFSDGQQAENMLRYMKWDDGIMGQCFIFMFRIICLKGCFIFKPWKWRSWDEMAIMGWWSSDVFWGWNHQAMCPEIFCSIHCELKALDEVALQGLQNPNGPTSLALRWPNKSRKDQTCLFGSIMFEHAKQKLWAVLRFGPIHSF